MPSPDTTMTGTSRKLVLEDELVSARVEATNLGRHLEKVLRDKEVDDAAAMEAAAKLAQRE